VFAYARRECRFAPGDRVLVAVSGGPDSVALLHLLVRLAPELGLTSAWPITTTASGGRTPGRMPTLSTIWPNAWTLPCHQGRGQVRDAARRGKVSLQMAARKLRWQFFRETSRRYAYTRVALGHTADDQVELFWLRLLRGAGWRG